VTFSPFLVIETVGWTASPPSGH